MSSSDGWTTVTSSSRRGGAASSSSSSSSSSYSRSGGFSESAARAFGSGSGRDSSGRRSWKVPARGEAKKPTMEEMFPSLPGSVPAPVITKKPVATSFASLVKKRAEDDVAEELERKAAEQYARMVRTYEESERTYSRIHGMYGERNTHRDTYDYNEAVDYGVDDLDNYAPANEKRRGCISDDLPPELDSSEDEDEAW